MKLVGDINTTLSVADKMQAKPNKSRRSEHNHRIVHYSGSPQPKFYGTIMSSNGLFEVEMRYMFIN